jgi:hypothetical protein
LCFSERPTATNFKTIHLVLYDDKYKRNEENYANRSFTTLTFFLVQQGQLNQRGYDWLDLETGRVKQTHCCYGNNNSIEVFIYELTQQPKGQLYNMHEQR